MLQRTLNSKRCGIAAREFAIVLPLIFMFLLGMWGMIHIRHALMAEAREPGRTASAGVPAGDAAHVINDYHSNAGLPTTGAKYIARPSWSDAADGHSPTNVSVIIEQEAERKKLGDHVESLLASIGVTKERYGAVKQNLGLEPACDCPDRQAWLNKWGDKVRNWWRSLLGIATDQDATHVGMSILTQDAHWA
jgi:hypothetical protein